MNTFSVAHPSLEGHRRILVISDIHGNLPYLRGLLEKVRLSPEDALILLGDLVEKGPQSLETLRYILSLRDQCSLYTVLGNCDFWHLWVDGDDPEWDAHTVEHLLHQRETMRSGLILEMCLESGLTLTRDTDLHLFKAELRERYRAEFDLLREMPFAMETDTYRFVHGGIPAGETLESAGAWRCMKINRYYDDRPHMGKWTIVGHTPVCLYGQDRISAVPIIDKRCRLISIDGGCVLKDDGQLNCLILQNGEITYDWYDPFPLIRADEGQKEGERSAYLRWGDNEVEALSLGREFCRIRHSRTGYEMEVPTDFLFEKNGKLLVSDVTDYRPAVEPGDILSLVRETSRGAWIKCNGVTGWYSGAFTRLPCVKGAVSEAAPP